MLININRRIVHQLGLAVSCLESEQLIQVLIDVIKWLFRNSSRAGVWLIFGPIVGTRMSHEPPKMCLTP